MPFCTQCSHAISEGGRFCPACGSPVALLVYGTATALAGKSILGDPLKDNPGR